MTYIHIDLVTSNIACLFQKLNKLEEALLKAENKKLPRSNGISDESDPNVTFIIDSEAENNPTNSSEAFRQFKELLENTTNPAEAICGSAKLMNMLTIGCDKGSVTMDARYKSRRERWFTKKAEGESNCGKSEKKQDERHLVLRRDSIIELHVNRGGQEQVMEYRALAFFQSTITSGLWQMSLSFCGKMTRISRFHMEGCWKGWLREMGYGRGG